MNMKLNCVNRIFITLRRLFLCGKVPLVMRKVNTVDYNNPAASSDKIMNPVRDKQFMVSSMVRYGSPQVEPFHEIKKYV